MQRRQSVALYPSGSLVEVPWGAMDPTEPASPHYSEWMGALIASPGVWSSAPPLAALLLRLADAAPRSHLEHRFQSVGGRGSDLTFGYRHVPQLQRRLGLEELVQRRLQRRIGGRELRLELAEH